VKRVPSALVYKKLSQKNGRRGRGKRALGGKVGRKVESAGYNGGKGRVMMEKKGLAMILARACCAVIGGERGRYKRMSPTRKGPRWAREACH